MQKTRYLFVQYEYGAKLNAGGFMMPAAGVEPARRFRQRILSPPRLPIPPRGLGRVSEKA